MSDSEANGSGEANPWTARLHDELSGRRVVIVGALASSTRMSSAVLSLGAAEVMLVGYGTPPDDWSGPVVTVARPPHGLLDLPAALVQLAPEDRRLVEIFDASRDALVIGPGFDTGSLWGRRYIGHRPGAWKALEDKTTVDGLWDAAGLGRAPSLVVAATGRELRSAAGRVDAGAGTVWSGDTATGRADGAELVFWVRDDDQAALAAAALERRCQRARVMPYLRGIPCSIHSVVGRNGSAAVMRPVENVTFRRPDGRFLWAGTHTWWDPGHRQREEMRKAAQLVASHIADTVGYRGPMGIDGVMTESGFVPTELNARWTFGMWPQAMVCPVPLDLVAAFVSSGLDGPMNALQDVVVAAADSARWGGPTLSGQSTVSAGSVRLDLHDAIAGPAQASSGKLWVKGSQDNATVTVRPDRDTSVGMSLLSLGLAGFALADEHFGTTIGPLLSPDEEP